MADIKFGTDGWRAQIAEDYTFPNVRRVSQAVADYVQTHGADKGVVVGYDTRFDSDLFAQAAAEVLAANGLRVRLSDSFLPTPALSWATVDHSAALGVMITASHNPAPDNGYKIKSAEGGAASPEIVGEIEGLIDKTPVKRMAFKEAMASGSISHFASLPTYFAQLGRMVDLQAIRDAGLSIGVDSMYGTGQGIYPALIGDGKTTIAQINGTRNPTFPGMHNPEPIARNLGGFMALVRDSDLDIGIANDGDADRVGIVDENGGFVNQLQVYALLALYMLDVRGERGAFIKSLSTTSMIDKLGKIYGSEVTETPVGFKNIAPPMVAKNAVMGGEESGGFAFRGHIPERDGILSGLFIVDFMLKTGRTVTGLLTLLEEKVGPSFYNRNDISFDPTARSQIIARLNKAAQTVTDIDGERVERVRTDDGYKWTTVGGSWLLIRFSGTEPIMRVYTETDDNARVERILAQGRELAGV